jgi:phosphoribosylanthranilate isomerase
MSFWIKICGITNYDDARTAVDLGADALGFNFFNKSRRFIEPDIARQIADKVPEKILKVGVFVNHDASRITEIVRTVGLSAVQLHGDERPQVVSELPPHVRVVCAHRCGADGLTSLGKFLDECHSLGRLPDVLLIDADAGDSFGGTGHVADWTLIKQQRETTMGLPLILAGGLTPDNVADAIAIVAPDGVDVASGVENAPGRKSPDLMNTFIKCAREASARL